MNEKIFTFGDGFAAGHIWPEWPQILQAVLPSHHIINTAAVGAGTEWLVHQLVNQLHNIKNSTVVFQWPPADRFDKLIEDREWEFIANACPVYAFNQHRSNNEHWWITSASPQKEVQEYHNKFVQQKQHQIRLQDYEILVANTLENSKCTYIKISTMDQELFSRNIDRNDLRLNEVQPSPWVHFKYVKEILLPQMPVVVDNRLLDRLENRILQHTWKAYDPDREEIWTQMSCL